jgi:oligopeptide/dipeptide ABC transporter ATP-binding protein
LTDPAVPVLQITNLVKTFDIRGGILGRTVRQVRAVDDVSLVHHRGQTLGVVGESGCGKTTLGRCIATLTEPTSGRIEIDGTDVVSLARHKSERPVQMVHQSSASALDPRMRVRASIGEGLEALRTLSRAEIDDQVHEAMLAVGLRPQDANRFPHTFSHGQQQRISLARALVLKPSLVVLDEPTSAVDVSIQAKLLNLLKNLQEAAGLTYVLISHDMRAIRSIADSVAVMYLGKLVEWGAARTVLSEPVHPYTRALLAAVPVADPNRRLDTIDSAQSLESTVTTWSGRGCPYVPRCPLAEPSCAEQMPAMDEVQPGHWVACPPASRLVGSEVRTANAG